jgi:hypothetical protein
LRLEYGNSKTANPSLTTTPYPAVKKNLSLLQLIRKYQLSLKKERLKKQAKTPRHCFREVSLTNCFSSWLATEIYEQTQEGR